MWEASFGPSVLRSFGPSVLRSFGPSVLRSFGPTVLRSYGPTVLRSYGPTVLRSYGQLPNFFFIALRSYYSVPRKKNLWESSSLIFHLPFLATPPPLLGVDKFTVGEFINLVWLCLTRRVERKMKKFKARSC